MFCQNCGNKLNDQAKFCSSCGAATMIMQGGDNNSPYTQYMSHKSVAPASHKKNIRLFGGVGVAALVIIFLFIGKGTFGSNVKQSTPVEAVQSFFQMIDKQNVEGFKKLISPEELMILKIEEGYSNEMIDYEVKRILTQLDYGLVMELGTDWIDQVVVLRSENYYDYFEVEVRLLGETDYIDVIRVGGKFYIDSSNF